MYTILILVKDAILHVPVLKTWFQGDKYGVEKAMFL